MKFLVDAQLPARLCEFLLASGHDAIHSSSLEQGNRTPDNTIAQCADMDGRTVITKDRDFRDSHLLSGSPRSMLIVSTGNISNRGLLALFQQHLDAIVQFLGDFSLVEMTGDALVAHATRDGQ